MGLNVPGDLSVVGFDDLPIAAFTTPSLTTVRMPIAQMAAAGVSAAVDEDKDDEAPKVQVLTPDIVIRNSSGLAKVLA
jgi:alanine racemase